MGRAYYMRTALIAEDIVDIRLENPRLSMDDVFDDIRKHADRIMGDLP